MGGVCRPARAWVGVGRRHAGRRVLHLKNTRKLVAFIAHLSGPTVVGCGRATECVAGADGKVPTRHPAEVARPLSEPATTLTYRPRFD